MAADDEELLKMQRRKSVPAVCIEEYVKNDGEDSDEDNANQENGNPNDDKKYKCKVHHEIHDVSISLQILFKFLN